jgi:hypothetical protein
LMPSAGGALALAEAEGEAAVSPLGVLVQDLMRRLPAMAEPMSKKSRLLKGRVI